QGARFASTVHLAPKVGPGRVHLSVDGTQTQQVAVPVPDAAAVQVPFTFTQRFNKPGPHVGTAKLVPADGPAAIAVDNGKHGVMDVVAELPVLLIDGDRKPGSESSTFFLDKALAGAGRDNAVVPRVVVHPDLTAAHILGGSAMQKPRAIILADVPALPPQSQAA